MGKVRKAHRCAFFLVNGYWPRVVMHTCDNPPCINPHHLQAGTQAKNSADRAAKGRNGDLRGERHGQAKITDVDVRFIRRADRTQAALADRFNLSVRQIRNIQSRHSWGHVR